MLLVAQEDSDISDDLQITKNVFKTYLDIKFLYFNS